MSILQKCGKPFIKSAYALHRVRQCATKLIIQLTMEKEELINFIDNKIKGCDEIANMDREKWAFIQVKKFINKRSNETKAVRQNEQTQEVCEHKLGRSKINYGYDVCTKCYALFPQKAN